MNTPEKLVFMHLPKTAGTTIHNILVDYFHQDDICPERFNKLDRYAQEQMDGWKYYSGHFNFSSVEKIPGTKKLITVLREPRSRVVSLYNYWKSHRDSHVAKHNLIGPPIAKNLSLEEFVESELPELSNNIDNVYTRVFSGYTGGERIKNMPREEQRNLLDKALENLSSFDFVGCLENPESSIEALLEHLNYPVPDLIPMDNSIAAKRLPPHLESIAKASLSDVSAQAIGNVTFLDEEIYKNYSSSLLN